MDELFVHSGLHRSYQDTVSVILVEDKYVFTSLVVCDWELAGEVGRCPLLGVDDIGEDLVEACLQFFHWFPFWGGLYPVSWCT